MSALAPPVAAIRHVRDAAAAHAVFAELAAGSQERCGFAYLDPEWMLLGTRESDPGSAIGASVPFRAVIGDALALDAAGVVMVHNHPGGDPTPSEADLAVTRRFAMVLDALDIRLIDHIVLAGDARTSLRDLGYL